MLKAIRRALKHMAGKRADIPQFVHIVDIRMVVDRDDVRRTGNYITVVHKFAASVSRISQEVCEACKCTRFKCEMLEQGGRVFLQPTGLLSYPGYNFAARFLKWWQQCERDHDGVASSILIVSATVYFPRDISIPVDCSRDIRAYRAIKEHREVAQMRRGGIYTHEDYRVDVIPEERSCGFKGLAEFGFEILLNAGDEQSAGIVVDSEAVGYRPDVLLVTVNRHETRAVVDAFSKATGRKGEAFSLGQLYVDLGVVNGTRVCLTLSEMGSCGVGGMQQTVDKAIRDLKPGAVIAIGIAFGVNAKDQRIGDVLISENLRLYELQRVGQRIIQRGDRPHSSARLVNYFKSFSQLAWDQSARVLPGVILTGEKLVDNVDYRNDLVECEPEVIGGEMEGTGLYVACNDHKVDWIVIKGISDWADGRKDEFRTARQKTAAGNAATFLVEALKYVPLGRQS